MLGLATDNGGFARTTWGWTALAVLLATVLLLWAGEVRRVSCRQVATVVALLALAGWTAASSLWASGAGLPLLETERTTLYVAVLAGAALLTARGGVAALASGVAAACVAVCAWALLARLTPGTAIAAGSFEGYRLMGPVGYANGLGLLAAVGTLLVLALAIHGRSRPARSAAAVVLVPLVATLTFTFSRGSWLALAVGIVVLLALERRRGTALVRLVAAAAAPAFAIWLCTRASLLTDPAASAAAVEREAHRLALYLAGTAFLAVPLSQALERLSPPAVSRRSIVRWGVVLAAAAVAAASVAVVRAGGPAHLVRRGLTTFRSDDTTSSGGARVLSLSGTGRGDYWRVAWREASAHPLLGGGGGSFGAWWLRLRPTGLGALDAHELYLETLAELGAVGLALLLGALALPLTAFGRVRGSPVAAACAAAYVAFLAHAALDWDWELPAAATAGLLCGAAVLAAAALEQRGVLVRAAARVVATGAVVVLACFVVVLHVGNVALSASNAAQERDDLRGALAAARRADRWQPWSAEPLLALGEAQLAAGDLESAARSFRRAIRRDSRDWELWYELGLATSGRERLRAVATARRLNPRGPELAELSGP